MGGRQALFVIIALLCVQLATAPSNLNVTGTIYGGGLTIPSGSIALPANSVSSAAVNFNYAASASKGGAASTATALAADGTNCAGGQVAAGVDASGNAQGCVAATTQWTTSGSNIYYTTGSVGINTSGPLAPLHVYKGVNNVDALLVSGADISKYLGIQSSATYGTIFHWTGSGWGNLALNPSGGSVGIGTSSPSTTLDVIGNVNIGPSSTFSNGEGWDKVIQMNSTVHTRISQHAGSMESRWVVHNGIYGAPPGGVIGMTGAHSFSIVTNSATRLKVEPDGIINVSGGTALKFYDADQTDTNDGKIGAGIFASGLNIVGAQTTGGTGRQVRIWGTVLDASGNTFWNAGNDGSGSGLDADTIDTIDSTQIVYGSNAAKVQGGASVSPNTPFSTYGSGFIDVWSGTEMPSGTTHIQGISARHSNLGGQWGIQIAGQYSQGGTLFTRGVSAGTWSSWYKIWSEANDGAASGLDADVLDGISSGSFMRSDAEGPFTSLYQSYNTGAPFDLGATATDYGGDNWNNNMILNGVDYTSIGFHDSGASVGSFGYHSNEFFITGAGSWGPVSMGINQKDPNGVRMQIENPSGYYETTYPYIGLSYATNQVFRVYMDGNWNTVMEQLQPAGNGVLILKPAQYVSVSSKRIADVASPVNDNDAVPKAWALANVGRPSTWTCTIRQGADGCSEEGSCGYEVGSTASCTGSEKAVSGGCGGDGLGSMRNNRPTGQGWYCSYSSANSVYAYANCCT